MTYPYDDPLRRLGDYGVGSTTHAMSMKGYDQVEISLIWVRLPFLSHVVRCSLVEMQSSHGQFSYIIGIHLKSSVS
jgi:hypothetical protein